MSCIENQHNQWLIQNFLNDGVLPVRKGVSIPNLEQRFELVLCPGHWRIQGSSWSKFLSFSYSFRQQSCQIIGFHPKLRGWEILDPPLLGYNFGTWGWVLSTSRCDVTAGTAAQSPHGRVDTVRSATVHYTIRARLTFYKQPHQNQVQQKQ